jgi:hypothetical protein
MLGSEIVSSAHTISWRPVEVCKFTADFDPASPAGSEDFPAMKVSTFL